MVVGFIYIGHLLLDRSGDSYNIQHNVFIFMFYLF